VCAGIADDLPFRLSRIVALRYCFSCFRLTNDHAREPIDFSAFCALRVDLNQAEVFMRRLRPWGSTADKLLT
jgi:hypothetical protein